MCAVWPSLNRNQEYSKPFRRILECIIGEADNPMSQTLGSIPGATNTHV